MSAQLPPDPILTTYQYWNWLNVDEATRRQRALDNNYMTFPTAQNYPTFFSKLFLITDATLTKMANTSYVYSLILALLSATTWTGSNQFNSIKVNTVANITLNNANFAGTTTLTNSTFNTPLTPMYAYPVIPVGAIGYRAPITVTRSFVGNFGVQGATVRGVNVTAGVWIMCGTIYWSSYPTWYTMLFTTTDNGFAGNLLQKGAVFPTSPPSNDLVTSILTTARLSAGFLGLAARCDGFQTITGSEFIVIRVA
jgi:hypothetical protein